MHVEADKRRREWYALYLGFEVRKESVANADGGNFSEDAERIVKRNNRKFSLGIRTRNLTTIEQLYTEDTVLMPPNNDMVKGRRGTREFWSAAIKMGLKSATLSTIEAQRCGDEIREIGIYRLRIVPEHKKAYEDVGKYLTVWKVQSDGSWRLQKDIWNSDLPKKDTK
ncbi:MAG: hypothetical protein A3K60_05045 [Euryarchaeota archaeon RBG_19FT_COMBO_56_21]|nr:MAG: hypothetical protein A3K60_05045 [Euryarchaeota archaeon RBG_19FT_COMBO_56_21]